MPTEIPKPPPVPYDCSRCKAGLTRRKIRDVFTESTLLCNKCLLFRQALRLCVNQKHLFDRASKTDALIDYDDEVWMWGSFGPKDFEMKIYHKNNRFPLTLEFCIDRYSSSSNASARESLRPQGGPPTKHDLRASVPWTTGSAMSVEWAKKRLASCEEEHHTCKPSNSLLPDRLLDLRFVPAQEGDIRLRQSKPGESGRYVTLSHGWGKKHPTKTLLCNLQTNQLGIALSSLSSRFRQVVGFVRDLGFHLLWIDSLCIVQDDVSDKLSQIPKMGDFYSNAVLNISISHSKDSVGDCFSVASPFGTGIRLGETIGFNTGLVVREKFPHFMANTLFTPGWSDEYFPLFDRAWVLQERFLSPRILHFGTHELHWECNSMKTCECNQDERGGMHKRDAAPSDLANWNDFRILVMDYSGLELSHESDILLALQGITHRFELLSGHQTVVGLWKQNFIMSLTWEPHVTNLRRRAARVPTWSWASTLSKVDYIPYGTDWCCEVTVEHPVDISVQFLARSDYALKVKAEVEEVNFVCDKLGNSQLRFSDRSLVSFKPDVSLIEGQTLHTARLGTARTPSENSEPYFLVVRILEQGRPNVFERVGFLCRSAKSERLEGSGIPEIAWKEFWIL